ncbi:hypothetical protein QBC46DRAFT_23287 [Diplogelasinospora grovesii]|uniref:Uncharacterized protein n=1 Tax=Diplogelasinospora grovesii TaxID=303347 RepID=A0AAN6N0B1_9PEZI|nr:hypothetical protein QBC46DRAFT_23287 [Diplogelasinospora grovesii]
MGSEDGDFKLLSDRFVEEHLIGIQYREVAYNRHLFIGFKTGAIKISKKAFEMKGALVFGGEEC